MQVLPIDRANPDPDIIGRAATVLRSGGIVVYPADTTYGIGVDPTNKLAVEKVYRLKNRDRSKALSLIVASIEQIKAMAVVDDRVEALLTNYLPGPYSFLLVNTNFRYCALSAVMVRIPNNAVTQALSEAFGQPYTTTSANISGEDPAYSVKELEATLLNPDTLTIVPDLILDAGELPRIPPSTIVDLTSWPPHVIREGPQPFDWKSIV